jgi:hypothetical protein
MTSGSLATGMVWAFGMGIGRNPKQPFLTMLQKPLANAGFMLATMGSYTSNAEWPRFGGGNAARSASQAADNNDKEKGNGNKHTNQKPG